MSRSTVRYGTPIHVPRACGARLLHGLSVKLGRPFPLHSLLSFQPFCSVQPSRSGSTFLGAGIAPTPSSSNLAVLGCACLRAAATNSLRNQRINAVAESMPRPSPRATGIGQSSLELAFPERRNAQTQSAPGARRALDASPRVTGELAGREFNEFARGSVIHASHSLGSPSFSTQIHFV